MSLFVDASIFIAGVMPDESVPVAQQAMLALRDRGGVVPNLWPIEVGNVLLLGVRRLRLTTTKAARIAAQLLRLPIEIDSETAGRALSDTFALAERHALTLYDAAYLELAARKGVPLATLDKALAKAAAREGVAVFRKT